MTKKNVYKAHLQQTVTKCKICLRYQCSTSSYKFPLRCTTEAERSAALLRFLNTSTDDRPERDQGQNCLRPYDVGMEALQAAHGLNNEVDQCCKRLQSVQPTQRLQIPWENEFQYLRSAITQQTLNAERQIRELLAKGQGGSSGILYPATESTEDGQWFGCSNLTRGVKKGQGCDLQWVSWGAAAHGLEKGVGHLVKDFSDSTMT